MVLLTLPDGRLVLQRRTDDAPVAPGLLGLFGGHVEDGETPEQAMRRELAEETSIDVDSLAITGGQEMFVPASAGFELDRNFYVYESAIASDRFQVFEGAGAETYTVDEVLARDDVSETVIKAIKDVRQA